MQENFDKLYRAFINSTGVFTDTRKPLDQGVFFALSGPNFNGNQYAEVALRSGASIAVVDDEEYVQENCILVEDSLETLQELANHHRNQFDIPVFALTGSNGKTTTKELISAVLSSHYNIISTSGNFNNHIGVPLTLLRIKPETEIAVIEMGANHVGEIGALCKIADPTHGLITNIGKAHLEGFGSYEGILRGKSELYDHLRKKGGQVFINSSDPVLSNMGKRFEAPLYFPNKGDFYHCEMIKSEPFVSIRTDGREIDTQLIGAYNFTNAAAALCLGKYFQVPVTSAEIAVRDYVPEMNRSQVITKGSNTIILDAYNANPDSMKAALDNLKATDSEQKIVILGDMLELGESTQSEHEELGRQVVAIGPKQALFCGELVKYASEVVPGSKHFPTKGELTNYLKDQSITDSTILIKASRGIGLETIMDVF